MASMQTYDVVVMGGGLAGLTLARQITRSRPQTQVLVLEKRRHPVPEAAFKVGESTVEIGAHYLAEVLDLQSHLQEAQLPKMGLRYFFSSEENRDITRRTEVGGSFWPKVPSYQLDRGRFENFLAEENIRSGIHHRDGCRVVDIQIDSQNHRLTLLQDGKSESQVSARWLVDASGRAALLKRRLGLAKPVTHKANAVWFRVGRKLDVDDWSDSSTWLQRLPADLRRLSTNHLMGHGYWVWLIPLASGSTSVGLVACPELHPLGKLRKFEALLDWFHQHEPQLAELIESCQDDVQDFRVLRDFAHGCSQVYSQDRWCITGEAGVFNDPFYSPGSDLIAISNGLIKDLICRDLDGQNVEERTAIYNQLFLNTFETWLPLYQNQLPTMGNSQIMTTKIIWDNATYWGVTALLYFKDKFTDLEFMQKAGDTLLRFSELNTRVQDFFVEWMALVGPGQQGSGTFVDLLKIQFLGDLQRGMADSLNDEELLQRMQQNIQLYEDLAVLLFKRAVQDLDVDLSGEAINPYAISLKPERWLGTGLFKTSTEEKSTQEPDWVSQMDPAWLTTESSSAVGA